MSEYYQATGLWKNSLGSRSTGHSDHMDTLRSAYQDFRRKAFVLTDQIAKALPALTIHDGTHLDALWETADLIAGPSYPINPLEGFVLGGAILLHDAALCFEAYEGVKRSFETRPSGETASLRYKSGHQHSKPPRHKTRQILLRYDFCMLAGQKNSLRQLGLVLTAIKFS